MVSSISFPHLQARVCQVSISSVVPMSCRAQEAVSESASMHQLKCFALRSREGLPVYVLGKPPSFCRRRLCLQKVTALAASDASYGQTAVLGRGSHQLQKLRNEGVLQKTSVGQPVWTVTKGLRRGARCSQAADRGPGREGQAVKTCSACGYTKLHVDFRERASSPDGYHTMCRACLAAFEAKQRGGELHHFKLTPAESWERAKVCVRCSCVKEIRDYAPLMTRPKFS
jgi:hypothetical protein